MSDVTHKGHTIRCAVCRKPFTARRSDAKYCGAACRQKAARIAKGARPATARKRAAKTKASTPLQKYCARCGKPFNATVAGAKRQYCTDACKLKAYRERKALAVDMLCILAMARGYGQAVDTVIRPTFEKWTAEALQRALSRALEIGTRPLAAVAPVQAVGVA